MGGGVESPQGSNTPGVAEGPRGDENPRGTTETEDGPREDGWRWGMDETPPTAEGTRTQVSDGGEGGPMGGLRTAEPPRI